MLGQFDFYGPKPFNDILTSQINNATWSPISINSIENKKYIVILDQATQSNVITLNQFNIEQVEMDSISAITGNSGTYGSMLRSIFQIVDKNTHFENDQGGGSGTYTPLSDTYRLSPILHSYYDLNSDGSSSAVITDAGTFYLSQRTNTGYVLLEFTGTSASTKIKALSQWVYDSTSNAIQENISWTTKYLTINGSNLSWINDSTIASNFFLADATDLLDIEIANGSDFNPTSILYQPNATAPIPSGIVGMNSSNLITRVPVDVNNYFIAQLGNSLNADSAASLSLDQVEATLISNGSSLRYPKAFYLAARKNMLSHKVASSDIFNGILGNNTIEHVYFTNAVDDSLNHHPFMVIAAHVVSSRPNLLLDVNRPPGATPGAQYAQSEVTRNGKLGTFLAKIPLKDYGLISTLLDNNLSNYGDLASDFDAKQGSTTTKDVYNYTGLASIGMAVDGVSIYPSQNNNLRFAVEDAEVTSSGIHVGGGLELHYHADGHAFNGNGINLYNLSDYITHDHPPVIALSYDGIALFGKYEVSFSSMDGYNVSLDQYGGHDHGDGFGYHYHAHTQVVTSSIQPAVSFNEHFLQVGAWKGNINNIPGFLQVKDNQLRDAAIGRYVGASYVLSIDDNTEFANNFSIYPNPCSEFLIINSKISSTLSIVNINGQVILNKNIKPGSIKISLSDYSAGTYLMKFITEKGVNTKRVVLK